MNLIDSYIIIHILNTFNIFLSYFRILLYHILGVLGFWGEIGLLLNNGGFSVTDIYARGSDTDTIGKVLNKWHRRLDKILDVEEVSNVVNFHG